MRLIGNIIWLICSGLWTAIAYVIFGVLLCLLIITIPYGIALFKLAGYVLWPFGRTLVKKPDAGAASLIGNVLWLIPGLMIAFTHLAAAVACLAACIFIITIPIALPFAVANLKLAVYAVWPFGREVVDASAVQAGYSQALRIG